MIAAAAAGNPTAPPPPPPLRLRGLHKTYRLGRHEVHALRGVDLALAPGELLALTGPSGSGKSTLLNIAGLIDRADAGELWLDGQPCAALDAAAATRLRRDAIGFVFQGFNLVPVMSVAENVDYPLCIAGVPRRERRSRVAAMLAAVGLQEHAAHRPDALSGGQRQRVAIARALVKQPRLVIADEPTASLDSATADAVLELMREQGHAHRAAFLIATHDERLLRRCDRVVALRDGRIVDPDTEEGRHE
jgi:putative ABC transport system ATP-binding protein